MNKLTLPASVEYLSQLLQFLEKELEEIDCPPKILTQISIASEEIFSNIAYYAYPNTTGEVQVNCCIEQEQSGVCIQFRDSGIQYNPLQKKDPNIHLSAEERDIGGLGIFMTKQLMDEVSYRYEEGYNCFTIRKEINKEFSVKR